MNVRMRTRYWLSASVFLLLGALLFVTSLPDRSRATDPLANPMPSRKTVGVDPTTGLVSESGNLCVQAWTDERPETIPRWYNWRCRVSVPGGGVAVRTDEFDYDAKNHDFKEFDEIIVRKDDPNERWHPNGDREYFLKLPNQTYARIKFEMVAQNHHFFHLESYLNPKPDRSNLEYDPLKRITP